VKNRVAIWEKAGYVVVVLDGNGLCVLIAEAFEPSAVKKLKVQ
jgi:hypothetical protein